MKRVELLEALKKVMPGVESKNVLLEGADSFMFDTEWIKTFNDDISVSIPFKAEVRCLVRAVEFFKIVSKIDTEEIRLVLLDENKIQVSGGKTVLKMVSSNPASILAMVDNLSLSDIKWVKLPADFTNGLALVEGFAATNSAFPARCGVSIGPDGLAATDGFRAGFYEMSIPVEDESILPIKAVGEILKFGNMESFSSVEGWLHFRSQDGVLFSVRKRKGDFPREGIKNLLNFDGLGAPFLFPEDMIKSLDRAAVLSSAGENGGEFVLLSLDPKGNLIIHGERQFGEINEKFLKSDKWSFPPGASLKVNPNFLMNILSQGREYYPKDDRYLLFKSGKFAGVIALVK